MSGRARRRILEFVLVSVLAIGCGSDGDGKESAGGEPGGEATEKTPAAPGLDLPGDGPVVLSDDEGKLSVVDPGGGQPVAIDAPPIDDDEPGIAVRAPGIAFFATREGELLQVDANARTAKVVGQLDDAGGELSYGNNGGGRRFVAFTNQYGREGLIVDIQAGLTRPVSEFVPPEDGGSSLGTVRISADEQFLFAEADDQIRLLSLAGGLAAAGAGTTLPGSKAFFNAEGTALFVGERVPEPSDEGSERVKRIPLDGSAEEVLVERADLFLGVTGDAALTREGDVYTLTGHPGDGRTVDLGITEGEAAAVEPTAVDGTGLITILNQETEKRRYAFSDPEAGSARPHEALNGFQEVVDPKDRFQLFSNFRLPDMGGSDDSDEGLPVGKGDYALLDTVTGAVKTASFDVGSHKQYARPFPSPDGTRVAVTRANEEGEPLTTVVSFTGKKSTNVDAGFVTWSPSGASFLVRRFVESETAMHIFIVENEKERDIAAGRLTTIVWTAR